MQQDGDRKSVNCQPLVFLNYRSSDDPSAATLLDIELSARFGRESVFLDYRSIPLGHTFEPVLLDTVRGCAVLLVVIGREWLAADSSGQRLIDRPDDWVRSEIAEAMACGIPVVPVLVGDLPALSAADLPAPLAGLASRQFARIRHRHQPQDINQLIDTLIEQNPRLRERAEETTLAAAAPDSPPARAVLSVATLTPDPHADTADWALDWVDRFDGDGPYTRRRPRPPFTWSQLQADIEAIPHHLNGQGAVLLTGSLRLAPAFAIGCALRRVTGMELAVNQGPQLWSSHEPYAAPARPRTTEHRIDHGDDLAVALAIATDPTAEVLDYLSESHLPVQRLLVLHSPGTVKDNSVGNAHDALALIIGIRDTVRQASRHHPRVHLFLATPMGLALLLGHRWNRVRPTLVYEDLHGPAGYEHAFTVAA